MSVCLSVLHVHEPDILVCVHMCVCVCVCVCVLCPDSPGTGGAGLWQSMGGGAGWVPPPGTDYESELMNDDTPPVTKSDQDEEQFADPHRPPVGVRRPDLFAPASEEKESSRSSLVNDQDDEDVNSEDGLVHEDDVGSRQHSRQNSRPTSRQGSRRTSREHDLYSRNPHLDESGGTLNSDMFRSAASQDPVDHSSMFQPDGSNGGEEGADNQETMFTNIEGGGSGGGGASASARWGSEDDID
jgi:hypothetical protein